MLKLAILCLSLVLAAPNHARETAVQTGQPALGIDPIVTGVSISQAEKDAWALRRANYLAGKIDMQDFPE